MPSPQDVVEVKLLPVNQSCSTIDQTTNLEKKASNRYTDSVKKTVIHPNYDKKRSQNFAWDLAILEVNEEIYIEPNTRIQSARLPPPELILTRHKIKAGGWGKTVATLEQVSTLSVIKVPVNHQKTCEGKFGDEFVKENMFSAGDKHATACKGDSGSGATLVVNDNTFLVGVVSSWHTQEL